MWDLEKLPKFYFPCSENVLLWPVITGLRYEALAKSTVLLQISLGVSQTSSVIPRLQEFGSAKDKFASFLVEQLSLSQLCPEACLQKALMSQASFCKVFVSSQLCILLLQLISTVSHHEFFDCICQISLPLIKMPACTSQPFQIQFWH